MDDLLLSINANGFSTEVIRKIDKFVNEIENGSRDFPQFNQPEHAGVCSAGPLLIGALTVCNYTREGLAAGCHASGSQGTCKREQSQIDLFSAERSRFSNQIQGTPTNWEIDQEQEIQLQKWAEAKGVWIPEAERWLTENYGSMIAQGAEAKVFYNTGDTAVTKLRTSIYATLGRALEAIALHNYLFPETIMRVIGFTRDTDGLFRIILTQPYIGCLRLATKKEIDAMVSAKGFTDNGDSTEVNYISDRLALEDMHPANVFVEEFTRKPVCIDCIVKFKR